MAYSTIRIDFANRRITRRMNASASTILRCWLMYHRNFPYPSILEKTILSLLTGLIDGLFMPVEDFVDIKTVLQKLNYTKKLK
ncbi:hypothetical protein U3516DRAFT_752326 [Neocallimastix sp. 'constans']